MTILQEIKATNCKFLQYFFFILFIVVLKTVFIPHQVFSYELRHTLKPGASFESIATLNSCATLMGSKLAVTCNPALFATQNLMELDFRMLGKAYGNSIKNTNKLLFEKIDQSFVQKIFAEENFNSLTFNSQIEFLTPYFILGYTPLYVMSDALVYNPALPQVSLALFKRNDIYLTSGLKMSHLIGELGENLYAGGKVTFASTKFLVQTLNLQEVIEPATFKSLTTFTTYHSLESNWGVYWHSNYTLLPDVGVVVNNVGSPYVVDEMALESDDAIEVKNQFETNSSFQFGKSFNLPIGEINLMTSIPFSDFFAEDMGEYTLALKYDLDFFKIYSSYSLYSKVFGFMSSSRKYSIGILYASEREIIGFNDSDKNSVYLNIEANFE